jgi:hypothetical protein
MSELQTEAIREHLTRVLASPLFDRSQRQSAFLRFVVEKTLEGRKDDIKEYEVAVQVYERRVDHSTRADPIVRVEASRLRAKLLEYYSGDGSTSPNSPRRLHRCRHYSPSRLQGPPLRLAVFGGCR